MLYRFYAGVFCISASTLMLQLIETRILSVLVWYHLAFFAISMAMFGLTVGAVWVYYRQQRYVAGGLSYYLAYFSTAFALSTVLSLAIQLTLTLTLALSITCILAWTLLATLISFPYVFSGITISLALTQSPYPIGRVYGVDLLGGAIGCLGVLLLLNLTDGPSGVIWTGAVSMAGAMMFSGSGLGGLPEKSPPLASFLRRGKAIFIALVILASANGLTAHGLQPLFVKDSVEKRHPSKLVFEEWNSFSRIRVTQFAAKGPPELWGPSPKTPLNLTADRKLLDIDGFVTTTMYRFDGDVNEAGFLKYDVTNLVYFLPDRKRAAVIGVGGGRDLLSAWIFGIRDITGIEVNPIFIKLLTADPYFADYAGLHKLGQIRFVIDEARNWFSRTKETFDIIQMTLADTEAANAAGAFTMSENGLYTVEGWRVFLERLAPHGIFTVSRWYSPTHVDETSRVISLAVATLLDLGVAEPRNHIFVAAAHNMATLLLSPSPFSVSDLEALTKAAGEYEYRILMSPSLKPSSEILQRILKVKDRASLEEIAKSFWLDLTPPTDDRPFFFNNLPYSKPGELIKHLFRQPSGLMWGNLLAALTLLIILIISLGLLLITIVIPLRPALKDVGSTLVFGGTFYFFLLGAGFMTVEIGLLQRMSVFLGHPIYSLSIVLFSLIFFTGLGSLISDRLWLDQPWKFVIWSLLTGGYLLSLPFWLTGALLAYDHANLVTRGALCIAIITPPGLLMGFGFPTGMRLASSWDPKPTPWFWGINGAAGVLAADVTVMISIAYGINAALRLGGICYLLLIPATLIIGFSGGESESAIQRTQLP